MRRARLPIAVIAALTSIAEGGCFESIPDLDTGRSCAPDTRIACYDGPAGTEGVGECRTGSAACGANAAAGSCEGQVLPAVESCATSPARIDDDCNGETNEHCATWATKYGTSDIQGIEGFSTLDGKDVVVAGRNTGDLDLGGGVFEASRPNAFVAQLGPAGEHRWSHAIASPSVAVGRALATLGATAYVGGWFRESVSVAGLTATLDDGTYTLYVAKLADGRGVWLRSYGGPGVQEVINVAATPDGGVVLTGIVSGSTSFGTVGTIVAKDSDVIVAKISASGAPIWARGLGDAGDDEATHVAVDARGDVFVTGAFASAIDFGCDVGSHASEGEPDAFIAKLSGADGGCVWSRAFGGDGDAIATALAVGANVHVAVTFTGSLAVPDGVPIASLADQDALLAVLDAGTGAVLRSKHFGGPGKQYTWDLAVGPDGSLAAAFSMNGEVDFGGGLITVPNVGAAADDAVLVLFDAAGKHVWTRRFGGDGDDDAFRVRFGPSGTLWAAGEFTGTIDLGTGPMLSDVTDAFLMRLDP